MHSAERHLSSQRLTHVMATRVRDDLLIYANDRDALLRSIEANPGDKSAALQLNGGRGAQNWADEYAVPKDSPLRSQEIPQPDPFIIDAATLRSNTKSSQNESIRQRTNQPEKAIDLSL
jgi:hypothetical protein